MQSLVRIISVGIFLVIAGSVVRSLFGMLLTFHRAGAIEFPTTGFTNCQVLIAAWIGTVDHTVRGSTTDMAFGDDGRIHLVDIYCDTVVKDIAFAFEVFPSGFHAVFDDAAVKLVHIFKSLLKQEGRSFFTLDSAGAISQNLLVFEVLELFYFLRKIPEVVDIECDGIFESAEFVLVIGADIQNHHIFLIFHFFEFLRLQMLASFHIGIQVAER